MCISALVHLINKTATSITMPRTLKQQEKEITSLKIQRRSAWAALKKQQTVINRLKSTRRYAWAKYFKLLEEHHYLEMRILDAMQQLDDTGACEDVDSPVKTIEHVTKEIENMMEELKKNVECPVCMEVIPKGSLKITSCGHKFCKTCVDKLDTCALCRYKLK